MTRRFCVINLTFWLGGLFTASYFVLRAPDWSFGSVSRSRRYTTKHRRLWKTFRSDENKGRTEHMICFYLVKNAGSLLNWRWLYQRRTRRHRRSVNNFCTGCFFIRIMILAKKKIRHAEKVFIGERGINLKRWICWRYCERCFTPRQKLLPWYWENVYNAQKEIYVSLWFISVKINRILLLLWKWLLFKAFISLRSYFDPILMRSISLLYGWYYRFLLFFGP